jgi:hypothetical protein
MKMLMPGMSKIVAVAAVCVVAWSFNAAAALANLAKGKTVTASSFEKPGMEGSKITDDDTSTKWGSKFDLYDQNSPLRDSAWFYIDFGATTTFDSIEIWWEHSAALEYNVQTCNANPTTNDQGWTTIAHITNEKYTDPDGGPPLHRHIKLATPSNARYLKVRTIDRNFIWGNSMYELQAFNVTGTKVTGNKENIVSHKSLTLDLTSTDSGVSIKLTDPKESTTADILAPNGQLIRHLSGNDASFWDYKDKSGKKVTNGSYMIRVTASGKTYQGKISINK